ncbi:hypothetical protein PLICRDRAFT_219476 [Plicaturopsis crispa FD-325 SS-3]|nr:hypothetical protein PLICRDRAFT_219476 [Plicaturopsis crispa FD-325 SS-3]
MQGRGRQDTHPDLDHKCLSCCLDVYSTSACKCTCNGFVVARVLEIARKRHAASPHVGAPSLQLEDTAIERVVGITPSFACY